MGGVPRSPHFAGEGQLGSNPFKKSFPAGVTSLIWTSARTTPLKMGLPRLLHPQQDLQSSTNPQEILPRDRKDQTALWPKRRRLAGVHSAVRGRRVLFLAQREQELRNATVAWLRSISFLLALASSHSCHFCLEAIFIDFLVSFLFFLGAVVVETPLG